MLGYSWASGKNGSTSSYLDRNSYYMIVGMEYQLHDQIMVRRRLNFPPLAEGINAYRRGTH